MKIYILFYKWKYSEKIIGVFSSLKDIEKAKQLYLEEEGWLDMDEELYYRTYVVNKSYPTWAKGEEELV